MAYASSETVVATGTAIQRPQRWDRPFGEGLAEADIDRVLAHPLFQDVDPERFPESLSLPDILRNDGRLVRYARGDLITREGDYGSSVFVILSGGVEVVLDRTSDAELGRRTGGRRRVWQALRQLWRNHREPEARDVTRYFQGRGDVAVRGGEEDARSYIVDVDGFLSRHETLRLTDGDTFGEIAALTRQARTASVVAAEDTEVLELRWQGVRDIRKRDASFRAYIDRLYRERQMAHRLGETPLLSHLDEDALNDLARHCTFETFGTFEWFASFKQVKGRDPSEVVAHEPVIAEEDHYLDGLLIVVSGFARVIQKRDQGYRTVGYIGCDEPFGLEEICANWVDRADLVARRGLRAIGYVDVLRIPTVLVQTHILPTLSPDQLDAWRAPKEEPGAPAQAEQCSDVGLDQGLVDFFVDNRTINGTATMLIDTDRCTACDDCVRACAETHDGNPRFKRHGAIYENLQVTNACMHCADPVCLIGCPTGAIHRHWSGPVVIDDATCIGCGTCANSCPYDNISMVEVRDRTGAFVVDEVSGEPIQKATKCDLCFDQLGGPACQRACPHDALIRVDMRDKDALARWVNRK
jgi:Fe-S-cluster-containing dehydrogenase component/CRP-like cAMP-binding protein